MLQLPVDCPDQSLKALRPVIIICDMRGFWKIAVVATAEQS